MVAFLAEEDFKSVQKHANLALGSILALSRKIWIKSYHQVSNISYKNGIEQNSCSSTQSLSDIAQQAIYPGNLRPDRSRRERKDEGTVKHFQVAHTM